MSLWFFFGKTYWRAFPARKRHQKEPFCPNIQNLKLNEIQLLGSYFLFKAKGRNIKVKGPCGRAQNHRFCQSLVTKRAKLRDRITCEDLHLEEPPNSFLPDKLTGNTRTGVYEFTSHRICGPKATLGPKDAKTRGRRGKIKPR